jgi:hypothetical protein
MELQAFAHARAFIEIMRFIRKIACVNKMLAKRARVTLVLDALAVWINVVMHGDEDKSKTAIPYECCQLHRLFIETMRFIRKIACVNKMLAKSTTATHSFWLRILASQCRGRSFLFKKMYVMSKNEEEVLQRNNDFCSNLVAAGIGTPTGPKPPHEVCVWLSMQKNVLILQPPTFHFGWGGPDLPRALGGLMGLASFVRPIFVGDAMGISMQLLFPAMPSSDNTYICTCRDKGYGQVGLCLITSAVVSGQRLEISWKKKENGQHTTILLVQTPLVGDVHQTDLPRTDLLPCVEIVAFIGDEITFTIDGFLFQPLCATFVVGTSAVDASGDMMKGHVTAPVIKSDKLKIDSWQAEWEA